MNLVKVQTVADELQLSARTVERWRERHGLPFIRQRHDVFYDLDVLREWIAARPWILENANLHRLRVVGKCLHCGQPIREVSRNNQRRPSQIRRQIYRRDAAMAGGVA